jgi:rhodanese-related sulfurtransferase
LVRFADNIIFCKQGSVHYSGAIHIPVAQLNERLAELKQFKDSPVITQCRSGRRSAKAFDVLNTAGFSKKFITWMAEYWFGIKRD